jgi:subtilisin family serine protease
MEGPPSRVLAQALEQITAAGILVIAAAGNSGTTDDAWPAASKHVLSVGATTREDKVANFSNYGPTVDIYAPGERIVGAARRSDLDFHHRSGTGIGKSTIPLSILWNPDSLTHD